VKSKLTVKNLRAEAKAFSEIESKYEEPSLYGVTDGKAVGTYLEQKFRMYLDARYDFEKGNSAKGIDFPELGVDMKVTSIRQPQSSCPFKSAKQKIFGLGYSLLVFVYEKTDDAANATGRLDIQHSIFVEKERTGDFQMTTGIRQIVSNAGNVDDLIAFFHDKVLPVDEVEAHTIAEEVIADPPEIGYLTISNALQWRLQYRRVIDSAGSVQGIIKVK